MAIYLQAIGVIIPIKVIEKKCKHLGGLKGVLKLSEKWVGKKILYDKYLYKDGAMSSGDIKDIVDYWIMQGLTPFKIKDGKTYWNDLAVIDLVIGLTHPCDWLIYDSKDFTIYMKGNPKGEIIVPDRLRKETINLF